MDSFEKVNIEKKNNFKLYLCKMKGQQRSCPSCLKKSEIIYSFLGSFVGIGLVAYLAYSLELPLLIPSFGASAVLLYGACNAPLAQPRNVIGGHFISAFIGISIYQLFGLSGFSLTLAVSLAIIGMMVTRTMHPPGGATAFLAIYSQQDYIFLLNPVILGTFLMVIVALIVNNLSSERHYPDYWI